MLVTTLNKIREHGPCEKGWRKLLDHLGKTKADAANVAIETIIDSNGLDDALWCLCAVERTSEVQRAERLFAVWCARQVQHLMSDQRSIGALGVAERHANGTATDEELDAARAAARAAAWDAAWAAAKDTARAAAWASAKDTARAAAWDAAKDTAWDAAWDAAKDTAWDAAWAAARAAARAAAWDAAWAASRAAAKDTAKDTAWDAARAAARAAAWDAAWAAARAAQIDKFRLICKAGNWID